MSEIKLQAVLRAVPTPALVQLKKQGNVPAELYGQGKTNQHLFVNSMDLQRAWEKAGSSSLVDLVIDGKETVKVIIHDIQRAPVKGVFNHADFYLVNMTKELETEIPLVFIGESKAVKEMGATSVQSLEKVEIACLPGDLVHNLEIDLSLLKQPGDIIRISDIKLPKGIRILNDANDAVASAMLIKEEVVAPVVEAVAEPVVAGKEGKDAKPAEGGKEEKKEVKK
jgi:large subunit ribosomal protein L25